MSFFLNYKGFDGGLMTGKGLIDFQKVIYTINHDMLLRKLSIICFPDDSVKCFQSYLSNQIFSVILENFLSRNFKHYMWCNTGVSTSSFIILDLC